MPPKINGIREFVLRSSASCRIEPHLAARLDFPVHSETPLCLSLEERLQLKVKVFLVKTLDFKMADLLPVSVQYKELILSPVSW